MSAPLSGLKIIELASIGPVPFACMLLADLGAEVIRVDRPGGGAMSATDSPADVLQRGRRSIAVDLKNAEGVEVILKLIEAAGVVVEGFRPGVMEKAGSRCLPTAQCQAGLRAHDRLGAGRSAGREAGVAKVIGRRRQDGFYGAV